MSTTSRIHVWREKLSCPFKYQMRDSHNKLSTSHHIAPIIAALQGYAYVEFTSPEVAGIVAETMNGYYLFDKQLVCRVLRFEEVHPNLFDGAGVKFRKVNWHGLYREKYNADRWEAFFCSAPTK